MMIMMMLTTRTAAMRWLMTDDAATADVVKNK
jgi:hypothetical protein